MARIGLPQFIQRQQAVIAQGGDALQAVGGGVPLQGEVRAVPPHGRGAQHDGGLSIAAVPQQVEPAPGVDVERGQQRAGQRRANAQLQQRIARQGGGDAFAPAFQSAGLAIVAIGGAFRLVDGVTLADVLQGRDEQPGAVPAGRRGGSDAALRILLGDVLHHAGAVPVGDLQPHAEQHAQHVGRLAGQQVAGHGPFQPAVVQVAEAQQAAIVGLLRLAAGDGLHMQGAAQPFVHRRGVAVRVALGAVMPDASLERLPVQGGAVVIDTEARALERCGGRIVDQLDDVVHWFASRHWRRSLKSDSSSGSAPLQTGNTTPQPSSAAARSAAVRPGLPSVWRSSSPAMTISVYG